MLNILPKDIWINEICCYFNFGDLKRLRIVCKWFKHQLIVYPIWKPWCSYLQFLSLLEDRTIDVKEIGMYGIYIGGIFDPSNDHIIENLPKYIKALDLIRCPNNTDILQLHVLIIEELHLSHNLMISSFSLISFLKSRPNLTIFFGSIGGRVFSSILHWACIHYSIEFPKYILETMKKTDLLNSVDEYQETPVFKVCRNGNIEILQLLLTYKVNLTIQNNVKDTPLVVAYRYNQIEVVRLILNYGHIPSDFERRVIKSIAEVNVNRDNIKKSFKDIYSNRC